MSNSKILFWSDVALAIFITALLSAIIFWTRGLSIETALIVAIVVFAVLIGAYIFVMSKKPSN